MARDLVFIEMEGYILEAARLMAEKEISSVLVKQGNEFSGIITDRDIIRKVVSKGLDQKKVKASEVMSTPPHHDRRRNLY